MLGSPQKIDSETQGSPQIDSEPHAEQEPDEVLKVQASEELKRESPVREKRTRVKRVKHVDHPSYFNKDRAQLNDKVSIHFSNGERASTGTVKSFPEGGLGLVEVTMNKGEQAFDAEDGETYYPGNRLTIHGSFLLPLTGDDLEKVEKTESEAHGRTFFVCLPPVATYAPFFI